MKNIKNILVYLIWAGLFITPFIAFIVPSAMFFPFISGKGFTFRIIVEIIFGLFVVLAFVDKEYRPKFSLITKAVLAFTAAILVADLLGVNVYKSLWSNYERMEGFVLVIHLAMYYMVASSLLKTAKSWGYYLNTTIVASAIMSLYGVLQVFGKITINQGGTRVDATFGNSAYLSIYLVLHIFLCLYMIVHFSKDKWQKWVYGLVALLEVFVLYFTATRGAILGLIGGLVIAGLIVAWKERENKIIRKSAYSIVGIIFVLTIGFISLRNTDYVKNNLVLSRFSTLSFSEFQTQGRYFVWPMALKGIAERPIFGWGQENFNFVFNKNYDPRMFGQEEWFDRTHDLILDWLIAGGIVGFLAYVSMYVAMFYYIWRKKSTLKLSEKSIFTGLFFAYIFHNIFVFDNLISYVVFFTILAYIHSLNVDESESKSKFYSKTFSLAHIQYIVAPVVIVLTGCMIYYVNVPAILANQTLIKAITPQSEAGGGVEQNYKYFKDVFSYNSFGNSEATEQLIEITSQINASPNLPDSSKKEFFDLAKQKIEAKVNQTPHDARYLVFAGSFYNRFGMFDDAIKYLERALQESPNKQSIYFELGTSYLGKGNLQKMFDLFKTAYDLKPTSGEAQVIYTLGAIYTKNNTVVQEMLKILDPNVFLTDNRFLKAYTDMGDSSSVIAILNARIAKNPDDLQSKYTLASTYATIGQKQKAIDLYNEMIKQEPRFKDQGEKLIKDIQSK